MTPSISTAALYALFAAIATTVNIGTQAITMAFYHGENSIPLSIIAGTVAGLPVKYWLDKKFIFHFRPINSIQDSKLFVLYSLMAFFTTLLFWLTEAIFHFMFNVEWIRYAGGVLGLSLGYAAKYYLDNKYVFVERLKEDCNDH